MPPEDIFGLEFPKKKVEVSRVFEREFGIQRLN